MKRKTLQTKQRPHKGPIVRTKKVKYRHELPDVIVDRQLMYGVGTRVLFARKRSIGELVSQCVIRTVDEKTGDVLMWDETFENWAWIRLTDEEIPSIQLKVLDGISLESVVLGEVENVVPVNEKDDVWNPPGEKGTDADQLTTVVEDTTAAVPEPGGCRDLEDGGCVPVGVLDVFPDAADCAGEVCVPEPTGVTDNVNVVAGDDVLT